MRLTADLINSSLSYINPLTERELDLRGHKIPAIENLGVAKDQDSIDFTDNDITTLGNFPLSPRLQTLLCARNRISSIQPTLHKTVPNLSTLVLTQNQMAELADLEPLAHFPKLTHLSLVENPVTGRENYRYWLLHLSPSLRFLDYQKVKDAERSKARQLFGTRSAPTELAQKIMSVRSRTTTSTTAGANGAPGTEKAAGRVRMTEKEKKRLEELIRNAKSLAEISRLEKELSEGRIPAGVVEGEEVEE
ncbi:U2 snRNP complex subunit [Coniosporium apollinis]|uniref:U2 small nuclear ribonucleoprotein A' n=1 Tax=Coniosporium apollinis TaxID=61459 RepID=A0ABQ9P502_9PEZI|nr:U2 snRNP complex subunit [Coniosporium apollinis]